MVQHGEAPYLECSSAGEKRFSAFFARIRGRGGKSIEEIYQAAKILEDGSTGHTTSNGKGKHPVNYAEVKILYSQLWDEYIAENPELIVLLTRASGLSDRYGRPTGVCQATELWRIRQKHYF